MSNHIELEQLRAEMDAAYAAAREAVREKTRATHAAAEAERAAWGDE